MTTPALAGLSTCLSPTRSTNFDEIASAAASGCTHSESARSRIDTPKHVMSADSTPFDSRPSARSHRRCAMRPAANASAICRGSSAKSRASTPIESSVARKAIWNSRASRSIG